MSQEISGAVEILQTALCVRACVYVCGCLCACMLVCACSCMCHGGKLFYPRVLCSVCAEVVVAGYCSSIYSYTKKYCPQTKVCVSNKTYKCGTMLGYFLQSPMMDLWFVRSPTHTKLLGP